MKDWKIGTRLGGGFALVLALVAVIASVGVVRLQGVGEATHDLARGSLEKERLAANWLLSTSTNSVRTFALLKSNDPEVHEFLQKNMSRPAPPSRRRRRSSKKCCRHPKSSR